MIIGDLVQIDDSKLLFKKESRWIYVLDESEEPVLFYFEDLAILLEFCKKSKFYLSPEEKTVKIITTKGSIVYCKQRLLKEA
jgi:hypothetical protein